jgi:hypothetical protein
MPGYSIEGVAFLSPGPGTQQDRGPGTRDHHTSIWWFETRTIWTLLTVYRWCHNATKNAAIQQCCKLFDDSCIRSRPRIASYEGILCPASELNAALQQITCFWKPSNPWRRAKDLDRGVLCGIRDLVTDDRCSIIDGEDTGMMVDYEQFSRCFWVHLVPRNKQQTTKRSRRSPKLLYTIINKNMAIASGGGMVVLATAVRSLRHSCTTPTNPPQQEQQPTKKNMPMITFDSISRSFEYRLLYTVVNSRGCGPSLVTSPLMSKTHI